MGTVCVRVCVFLGCWYKLSCLLVCHPMQPCWLLPVPTAWRRLCLVAGARTGPLRCGLLCVCVCVWGRDGILHRVCVLKKKGGKEHARVLCLIAWLKHRLPGRS